MGVPGFILMMSASTIGEKPAIETAAGDLDGLQRRFVALLKPTVDRFASSLVMD